MKPVFALLLSLLFAVQSGYAQGETRIRYGNLLYEGGNYAAAEESYRKALEENPTNSNGTLNLGNAIYKQERYEEAAKHFLSAANLAKDKSTKAEALHNAGNAYLQDQKLAESVNSFKESLKNDPSSLATKKNLSLAMKMLKQQQKQQEEQKDQQDENQEEQEGEKNQDEQQEQKEEEKKQQEQQKQEEEEGKQGQEKEKEQSSEQQEDKEIEQSEASEDRPKSQEMSRAEALKILEVMDNEEKKVQEKLRKVKGEPNKTDKDW